MEEIELLRENLESADCLIRVMLTRLGGHIEITNEEAFASLSGQGLVYGHERSRKLHSHLAAARGCEMIPAVWNIQRTSDDQQIIVSKPDVGGYVARPNEDNIASEILFELADDMLLASEATTTWQQRLAAESTDIGARLAKLREFLTTDAYLVLPFDDRAMLSAAPAPAVEGLEVVAWMRECSDGGIEGPIMDCDRRIDDTRRKFWTGLVRHSDAARLIAELTQERDTLRARCESLSPFPTEALASLEQQNAELRARLADLEKARTEPVATWNGYGWSEEKQFLAQCSRLEVGAELYAAPPDAQAIIAAKDAELEIERGRLAACGVVAMSNTPESAARARKMKPKYRSASCDDVGNAVDREMRLRAEVERLTAELNAATLEHDMRKMAEKRNGELVAELAEAQKDVDRLNWMIRHSDATICLSGTYGPFHIWYRYTNRTTEPAKSAREAIDAEMKGSK